MTSPFPGNTRRARIRIALAAFLALAVLAALVLLTNLPAADQPPGPASPEPSPPATSAPSPAAEGPAVETSSFSGSGDVADDAAIWVDPANPANSVVIADNKASKGGGIGVFGMDGKLVHFRPDGMIGNVDLRTGFPLSGR